MERGQHQHGLGGHDYQSEQRNHLSGASAGREQPRPRPLVSLRQHQGRPSRRHVGNQGGASQRRAARVLYCAFRQRFGGHPTRLKIFVQRWNYLDRASDRVRIWHSRWCELPLPCDRPDQRRRPSGAGASQEPARRRPLVGRLYGDARHACSRPSAPTLTAGDHKLLVNWSAATATTAPQSPTTTRATPPTAAAVGANGSRTPTAPRTARSSPGSRRIRPIRSKSGRRTPTATAPGRRRANAHAGRLARPQSCTSTTAIRAGSTSSGLTTLASSRPASTEPSRSPAPAWPPGATTWS